eukprot:436844_1
MASHPHQSLPKAALSQISIRNRKVCAVEGLPAFTNESLLRDTKWYGQFKGIVEISIHKSRHRVKAFITFDNTQNALKAINFSNTAEFDDGRQLKATFGMTYYCRYFLSQQKCMTINCRYIHKWVATQDVITDKDVRNFSIKSCGLVNKLNNFKQSNVHSCVPKPKKNDVVSEQNESETN